MPGYSSFKQYNLAFLILKDTYHYFDRIEEKEKAIKAVINAQNDPMRWRNATWQMKVNLIYDMRHEERGFGGYSLEERGQAVLDVLESARHDTEFGKMLEGLMRPENASRVPVFVENLTKGLELDLIRIKRQFNYLY